MYLYIYMYTCMSIIGVHMLVLICVCSLLIVCALFLYEYHWCSQNGVDMCVFIVDCVRIIPPCDLARVCHQSFSRGDRQKTVTTMLRLLIQFL